MSKVILKTDEGYQRAPRMELRENKFVVRSKTIGTDDSYNLRAENFSKSGFLLSWKNSFSVPFAENTLIELVIDPNNICLEEPLEFLGKVVRTMDPKKRNTLERYAIKIVPLEDDDVEKWTNCVNSLQKKAVNTIAG